MDKQELTVVRHVVAAIWLISGVLSLGLYPMEQSMAMLQPAGLPPTLAMLIVYGGAFADILMAVLTWWFPRRQVWVSQMALILAYTLLGTWLVPEQWLHPFAPFVKNAAVLALLWLLYRHDIRGAEPR